jgi:hypothetical protein
LIELGILTPDCGLSATHRKLSPELKREATGWMKETEGMTGGRLLSRILALDDRKGKATIIDRVGNMQPGA